MTTGQSPYNIFLRLDLCVYTNTMTANFIPGKIPYNTMIIKGFYFILFWSKIKLFNINTLPNFLPSLLSSAIYGGGRVRVKEKLCGNKL